MRRRGEQTGGEEGRRRGEEAGGDEGRRQEETRGANRGRRGEETRGGDRTTYRLRADVLDGAGQQRGVASVESHVVRAG